MDRMDPNDMFQNPGLVPQETDMALAQKWTSVFLIIALARLQPYKPKNLIEMKQTKLPSRHHYVVSVGYSSVDR